MSESLESLCTEQASLHMSGVVAVTGTHSDCQQKQTDPVDPVCSISQECNYGSSKVQTWSDGCNRKARAYNNVHSDMTSSFLAALCAALSIIVVT